MIYIFYSKCASYSRKFHSYLYELPAAFQDQILKFRNWKDAQRSLYGKLLLKSGMNYLGLQDYTLSDLKYSAYQRPYFDHSFDFNIAHSGDYVLCAISKTNKVGIDIEEVKATEVSDYHELFNGQEWATITRSHQHLYEFYKLWTQKEALIKASGEGLSLPLKEVLITGNKAVIKDKNWHLYPLNLDNHYVSYLATDSATKEIALRQVHF